MALSLYKKHFDTFDVYVLQGSQIWTFGEEALNIDIADIKSSIEKEVPLNKHIMALRNRIFKDFGDDIKPEDIDAWFKNIMIK